MVNEFMRQNKILCYHNLVSSYRNGIRIIDFEKKFLFKLFFKHTQAINFEFT